LDTAIDWGRYAELLAYDDSSQILFLEPGGVPGLVRGSAELSGPH